VAARLIMGLSVVALGLLSGGMLFIAVSLMSAWQAMPPADFQSWFAAHSGRIAALMLPLGFIPVLLAIAAIPLAWRSDARVWALIAAICAVLVVIEYPIFFAGANARFAGGGMTGDEVRSLLGQWAAWHWSRTILGLPGFVAAILALARYSPRSRTIG
jgi:hypothetical protein